MPFTIKNKYLGESRFQSALQKIFAHANWSNVQVKYNAGKIVTACDRKWNEIRNLHGTLLDKHIEKDEKGNRVIDPESNATFKFMEGHQELFEADLKELMEAEFTVERFQLPAGDIKKVNLTAAELDAIEPLIDFSDPSEDWRDGPLPDKELEVSQPQV